MSDTPAGEAPHPRKHAGPLAWFATNHVAANLLMLLFIALGMLSLSKITVEVFPEVELDMVTVSVAYPGASPSEVEQGVIERLEEEIDGIVGIKRLRATASEGIGTVVVEVESDADADDVRNEVEAAVGRVATLPDDAERPIVSQVDTARQVVDVVIFGDVPERTLRELGERVRDDLTSLPEISQAELVGIRDYEINIEISEVQLRRFGLTFAEVARVIREASLDLPGGSIKTEGGEVLLRTQGQRYVGREFQDIVLLTNPDGTRIRLGDVADVRDDFRDSDVAARFNGQPAAVIQVFRVGEQGALDLSDAVNRYVDNAKGTLPEGVSIETWRDTSLILKSRIELLLRNAAMGLVLVFVCLSLFLDLRLAFWTMAAIPMSFMGSFIVLDALGMTINMISLFGLIVVLGLVVDDAIVVGENVFHHLQDGDAPSEAAIRGVREMAAPVTFAVLTTVAAFGPLLVVEGIMGEFLAQIPIVVISVLMISLVDALLVLPAHLNSKRRAGKPGPIARMQDVIRRGLNWVIEKPYDWSLKWALAWRPVTLAVALFMLVVCGGLVAGGHIRFEFLPDIDSDQVVATLAMPQGTPISQTQQVVSRLEHAVELLEAQLAEGRDPDQPPVIKHMYTALGTQPTSNEQRGPGGMGGGSGLGASHLAEITLELQDGETRDMAASEVRDRWRNLVGEVPGVSSLNFESSLFSAGDDIGIELRHPGEDELVDAAERLKQAIANYPGTRDVSDSFEAGKQELRLGLTETGRSMGLSLQELATQVRNAFYGEEAQRIQRGRNEVRVMVRYPEDDRRSVGDIEDMRVRLDDGTEVPFTTVATLEEGRGYAVISRTDRNRVITVTADVDASIADPNTIIADLRDRVLPAMQSDDPQLTYSFEGSRREQEEALASLAVNFGVGMFLIYALLAIPFRSYTQPLIVMSAIPFGFVGAVIGHMIMGYNLSLMSFFGLVALAGVVVNDSLIIIDLINRERDEGKPLRPVIREAGKRRFRPILLTTLTTFFGLMPMIFETSLQAKFLIPMTLSLGFGVLFATVITLILVPALYMTLEDIHDIFKWSRDSDQPAT